MERPPCFNFNTTRNGNTSHSGSRPDETRHFSECAASARPSRTCNAGPALARSSCSSAGEARSSGERSAGLEAAHSTSCSGSDEWGALFEEAFESALTKFGSLDAYFANGMLVPDVCAMIAEEMRSDTDFALTLADEAERFALWLRKTVGKANGAWRKGAGGAMGAKKSRALRDNPLPWASIDAYPEWIAALLSNYKRVAAASATADDACSCEERARARRALEGALLPTPLRAASIKYDGTCFGKLDTGELVGRKQTLGAACAESNDPTCGGSDGGTGVTAAPPPRRPPPPRA